MSDGKIQITEEDLASAQPPPPSRDAAPQTAYDGGIPAYDAYGAPPAPPQKQGGGCLKFFLGVVCTLVVVVIVAAGILFLGPGRSSGGGGFGQEEEQAVTVAQVGEELRMAWNDQLKDPAHPLRRRIENSQIVTVNTAYIRGVEVRTLDGTENAGANLENLMLVKISFYFDWQGLVNPGHSVLDVAIDCRTGEVVESRIAETTAVINLEDPQLWFDVGALAGELFMDAFFGE